MPNDRPTTDLSPTDIVGAFESFTGSVGDFIANGQPESQIGQAIQQGYRKACDAYSRGPSWATGFNPTNRAILDNMCDPWLASQGSGGPVLSVPFQGGQCPTVYIVRGTIKDASNPPTNRQQAGVPGPISQISTEIKDIPGSPNKDYVFFYVDGNGFKGSIYAVTQAPGAEFTLTSPSVVRQDGQPDNCGNPAPEVKPNPNPRPDPNLGPDDQPFEDDRGRPVIPMPPITDPFGEPVELPNIPLPDLFGDGAGGGAPSPNAGPSVEPASPQAGNGNSGGDDDFGDPPEGHQWVGFIVKLSDQGLTEGLEVNSPPHPIYKSQTGNYRGKYDVDGDTVYSTPRPIKQETSAYFLELPGLQLTGARVNVPGNDSYTITPLSQPVESESPPQEV